MLWNCPKPLCILISDTKEIQWVDTDATEGLVIVSKEGLSFPVRALVLIIDNLVLAPTLEFHFDQV